MSISRTGTYHDVIGGADYPMLLRNAEIERFEDQYSPLGIFELWDRLMGRGMAPQARHVRDLIALGLVGAGMSDRAADALIAAQAPSENLHLRGVAQRLLGVTFLPAVMDTKTKKKAGGSRRRKTTPADQGDGTPVPASPTSAA